MSVHLTCLNPACRQTALPPDTAEGKTLKCPDCGRMFGAKPIGAATFAQPTTDDSGLKDVKPAPVTLTV